GLGQPCNARAAALLSRGSEASTSKRSVRMTQDDLPFEGVKVLDLSQGVAGPYCGMHLARNGADVIKAEPTGSGCWSRQLGRPTGDQTAHSVVVNRAKRSLAVDLKTDQGVAIVQRLAKQCDVFIQ